jgi:hypothetical protein
MTRSSGIHLAGSQVGANIAQWWHVRLFSPWCLALDPVGVRLLERSGWTGPDPKALPTRAGLLERYLEPLAAVAALAEDGRPRPAHRL